MESVAVIGVGMIGAPIANLLSKAGHDVIVCDTAERSLDAFRRRGIRTTTRPAHCATSDLVLVVVNTSAQVKAVVCGTDGVTAGIDAARPPLIVVMSTVAPATIREVAQDLANHGATVIDAPVSGGDQRAADGTLTVMIGGDPADVQRATPVLNQLGTNLFHCGTLGAGETMKALNNVLSTLNAIVSAEVLRLAADIGMTSDQVAQILEVSTGRNFLTARPAEVSEYFARFTESREVWDSILHLFRKDAALAVQVAAEADGSYPVIEFMPDLLLRLGDESFSNWLAVPGVTTDRSIASSPQLAALAPAVTSAPLPDLSPHGSTTPEAGLPK